jgi:hypothetical protein
MHTFQSFMAVRGCYHSLIFSVADEPEFFFVADGNVLCDFKAFFFARDVILKLDSTGFFFPSSAVVARVTPTLSHRFRRREWQCIRRARRPLA